MKFSATALLAFVATAIAQTPNFNPVSSPDNWGTYESGKTLSIDWAPTEAYNGKTLKISLIGGATQGTQIPLSTIATGVPNEAGHYSWAIPAALGDQAVYGLVIAVEGEETTFQYSNPFKISQSEPEEEDDKTEEEDDKTEDKTEDDKPDYDLPGSVTKTLTASQGVKTVHVSLTSTVPCTTLVPIIKTTAVPCNTTTVVPPAIHTTIQTKVIEQPCYGNCTHNTVVAPPPKYTVTANPPPKPTHPAEPVVPVVPSNPGQPGIPTPTPVPEVPVTGAATRIGASMAVAAGFIMAAFAL